VSKAKKPTQDAAIDSLMQLCQRVGSEYALSIFKMVQEGQWASIASSKISPGAYHNARDFQLDYLINSYLRKYKGFPATEDLEKKARLSFEKVELKCAETNFKVKYGRLEKDVEGIISVARRKIARILGPFSYARVLRHCEWGNGATASLTARHATIDKKILEPRLHVTRRCVKYAVAYLTYDLHWLRARIPSCEGPCTLLPCEFDVSEDGRFTTVPKNISSVRSIDIQPTLNLFFQKGVGKCIRKCLQRHGIDLDDQSRNQILASSALSAALATIDLANASDSVSLELVRALLPEDWFEYLNDIRTHSISIDGSSHVLEKFSAMGNGFTFELESLIFYSLCLAVQEETGMLASTVAVYGDDIIVSQTIADRLIAVLNEVGFEVNVEKTYTSGRFYESCGKHYFDNRDVTPIFQKEVVCDLGSAIRAANRLLRFAALSGGTFLDDIVYHPWTLYVNLARGFHRGFTLRRSSKRRPFPIGPFGYEGDEFLHDPYYVLVYDRDGIGHVWTLRESSVKQKADDGALYATSLRRGVVVDSPFNGQVSLRGQTRALLTRRRVYCLENEVPVWGCTYR